MPRINKFAVAFATAAFFCVSLCALLIAAPSARADAPTAGAPYSYGQSGRFTVGGKWFVRADPRNFGQRQRYAATKDFSAWTPITIPHSFNAGDASENSYTGSIAWYATEFTRPKTPRGGKWILQFNSVNYRATVYLNGRKIGAHTGGYLPFELDARTIKGGVNRLVIRVDSRLSEYSIPSQELRNDVLTGGWWNYGGMLREVVIRRVKDWDISTVSTTSRFKSNRGPVKVTVKARVRYLGKRKRARVRLAAKFGSARIVFRPATFRRGRSAELIGTAVVRKPKLWEPLKPNLYRVSVRAPGVNHVHRAGIRRISVSKNGSLSINGKKTRLRGVSYHEADDLVGAAWRPGERQANQALIQKLGANMIRSHYPISPQDMEWADANGILVWVQAPVFRPRENQLRSSRFRKNAVAYTREMVVANRRHASVLVWSLMNEPVPSGTTNLNKVLSAQRSAAKKLDTNLVGADYAAAPEDELQHPAYRKMDVLGINEYFGWYPGLLGTTLDMGQLRPYLDYLKSAYARQAFFVTEFGAEANRSGPADELGTYEFQAKFMVDQMRILRETPQLNGFFAWALKDYWVRPGWGGGNPDPSPPYSKKGLFDQYGNPKPAAAEVEREFKATPPFK